jgi:hypothetical protein
MVTTAPPSDFGALLHHHDGAVFAELGIDDIQKVHDGLSLLSK